MAHPTAVFALLLSTAQAGPWIKDPGSWYVKASGAQFQANQYIDPLVEADGALDYSSLSVLGYGEVGVAPGVQVHATVPYLWATNQGRETGWTYRQRGMGDLAGVRQSGVNGEGLEDFDGDVDLLLAARDVARSMPELAYHYAGAGARGITP